MEDSIPDLWSDEIGLDILSPVIILNTQAANIKKRTKGLTVAELIQRRSKNVTELYFDLKSQVANHRNRLMVCRHVGDEIYPVYVTARNFFENLPVRISPEDPLNLDQDQWQMTRIASSESEFIALVSMVLTSAAVRTKISSMIAKSNETRQPLDHLIVEEVLSENASN